MKGLRRVYGGVWGLFFVEVGYCGKLFYKGRSGGMLLPFLSAQGIVRDGLPLFPFIRGVGSGRSVVRGGGEGGGELGQE